MNISSTRKKIRTTLVILIILLIGIAIASYAYVTTYYHASASVETSLANNAQVTVTTSKDGTIIFTPEHPIAGFIFYQGGKVETTAYAPLLHQLAENDILCILPQMPSNLAVLDINAAKGYQEQFSEITDWYIGGHSLGGSMSASYVSNHTDDFEGLILLAAYSSTDLSDTSLSVLSLYGSNDGVLNMKNYQKYFSNLPEDTLEFVIDGGCHSYFGTYGVQKGDGTPTISNQEQINTTVDYIMYFINHSDSQGS